MQVPLLVAARAHLADFLAAYNFAKCLKTLCGLTPHEYVCKIWTENPGRFRLDSIHHTTGPASERIKAKNLGLHQFLQHNATTTPGESAEYHWGSPGTWKTAYRSFYYEGAPEPEDLVLDLPPRRCS